MVKSTCLCWKSSCDPVSWEYILPPVHPQRLSHCISDQCLSPWFLSKAWRKQRMKTQCSFHSNIFRMKGMKGGGKKWNSTMILVLNTSQWVVCSKQSVLGFIYVKAVEVVSESFQFQILPAGDGNRNSTMYFLALIVVTLLNNMINEYLFW